jgi:GAF domain-containing protein/HAMP domain-containing protein
MNTETGKPKRTQSLTTTLALAYFGVSAFALVLASSVQIALNIQSQQAALSNKQQLIAQDAGKTISNFIQERFSSLEVAVEVANPIISTPEARTNVMESLLSTHPAFKQLALLDRQGRELVLISPSSQTVSSQFADHLKGEVLTKVLSEKRYISPVYIDNATREPLTAIAIPVTSVRGDVQGILIAEVNLKYVWDLVGQFKVGNKGYIYVVDELGNLIAYKNTDLVLQNENLTRIVEVNQFVQNPNSQTKLTPGLETYVGLSGSKVVGTYATLSAPKWAVIIELPMNEAYQNITPLMIQSLGIILGIAILSGYIGSLGARRFSVSPIIELSNVANEVAKGNLGLQAKPNGPTEIVNLAVAFNSMTRQLGDLINNLEKRVDERTNEIDRRINQLKAVADVGKSITSFRDLSELLHQATHLINENFGYYHIGIFLLDEHKEYAILTASNSEGGRRMLEKKHQLKVGETGIVGYVTRNAKARIALDVGTDAVYFDNPDLPETRSEMALPLIVSGQVLGALDVQSTEPQAFSEEDISTLQVLAEQIAIAIQNANLFKEAEKALETSNMSYGEVSRRAWSKILRSQPRIGFLATQPTTVQVQSENLEINLAKASESGDLIIGGDGLTISMPIRVRGQTIGAIRMKKSAISESWTQDETNLAIALSDQLSGALESARLYKESQQHAARESLISEISARISAVSQTDAILRETVQELGQTLGNASVTFQLLDQFDGKSQPRGDVPSVSKGNGRRSETPDSAKEARE